MPKALAGDGRWLRRSVAALVDGGCDPVLVVLGAAADQAVPLVPPPARAVIAAGWDEGMGASLRAGLAAVSAALPVMVPAAQVEATLIHLVDLPDIGSAVVRRMVGHASPDAVARAVFDGRPGHPVLLGRDHWPAVAAGAAGDRGARDWLAARADLVLVECSDLATGTDVDRADGNC
ncbi:MAG: NTP transferase domain-containing protein [Actinomycetota bacterium]|nr:NTP transferase domain-containing protein [Actinomycetota bacterium]